MIQKRKAPVWMVTAHACVVHGCVALGPRAASFAAKHALCLSLDKAHCIIFHIELKHHIHNMPSLRVLATLLVAATAALASTDGANVHKPHVRALAATKSTFEWVEDPHAADPCTIAPDCVNHIKYGFNVVPRNISTDANIVFQEAKRPKGLAAVLYFDIFTQPGCVISGCTTKKWLGLFPKEECFNAFAEKVANQPDNTTTLVTFGGNYYENVPAGELYAKFERKNYLTEKPTCTFQVRSGFKRWY